MKRTFYYLTAIAILVTAMGGVQAAPWDFFEDYEEELEAQKEALEDYEEKLGGQKENKSNHDPGPDIEVEFFGFPNFQSETDSEPVSIAIYDAPHDGEELWTETHMVGDLKDLETLGLPIILGIQTPLSRDLFGAEELYVEFKVGGLPPERFPLDSVQYTVQALYAAEALTCNSAAKLGELAPSDVAKSPPQACGETQRLTAVDNVGTLSCVDTVVESAVNFPECQGTERLTVDDQGALRCAESVVTVPNVACEPAEKLTVVDSNGTLECVPDTTYVEGDGIQFSLGQVLCKGGGDCDSSSSVTIGIAFGGVTANELGDAAVQSRHIAPDQIHEEHLADGQITKDKFKARARVYEVHGDCHAPGSLTATGSCKPRECFGIYPGLYSVPTVYYGYYNCSGGCKPDASFINVVSEATTGNHINLWCDNSPLGWLLKD